MSENKDIMKGNEFIRLIKAYAKKKGIECLHDEARGKGSHTTLHLGAKLTIVRNPKDELKTGTFHSMLKQLGLKPEDL